MGISKRLPLWTAVAKRSGDTAFECKQTFRST